ncbi:hypothetical protein BDQ17DRAFT_1420989 [Cyathus striatus]|nr:hypothetical protein BDQ17DRAFT_1420989 [Cyathus striatus]
MTVSDIERQRYTQELAAYTLRQFASARSLLDGHKKAAMAKLPAPQIRVFRNAEKASQSKYSSLMKA